MENSERCNWENKNKWESSPKKIALENKEITDQKTIVEKFNDFYVNVGPNLASKIPQNNNDYKSYLPDITTLFDEQDLTEQELKEAVASLKPNKSPGCDNIHVNVIKAIYEKLKRPLFYIFDQSLKSGIFPDKLKIAKVFPIYKSGKKYVLSNYWPNYQINICSSAFFKNTRKNNVQ